MNLTISDVTSMTLINSALKGLTHLPDEISRETAVYKFFI